MCPFCLTTSEVIIKYDNGGLKCEYVHKETCPRYMVPKHTDVPELKRVLVNGEYVKAKVIDPNECPFCLTFSKHKKACPRFDVVVDLQDQVKKWKTAYFDAKNSIGKCYWEVPTISYLFGSQNINPKNIIEFQRGAPYIRGFLIMLEGFFKICAMVK